MNIPGPSNGDFVGSSAVGVFTGGVVFDGAVSGFGIEMLGILPGVEFA